MLLAGLALGALSGLGLGQLGIMNWGGYAVLICGCAGALVMLTRARKLLWVCSVLIVSALLVISYTPLMRALRGGLERRDDLRPCQAVVVLGSMSFADGTPEGQLQQRLLRGYALLRQGYASSLVLTRPAEPAIPWDEAARRQMQELRISAEVEVVGPVRNTHDEAVAAASLARQRGWSCVILVTQPWHMRRAAAAFEKAGLHVLCSPASEARYDWTTLHGPGDKLGCFRDWLHEFLGYRFYRFRGWI